MANSGGARPAPDADISAQLLEFMDKTTDLVGIVDEESRVLYLNEAARKRLGVGDSADLTSADLFPPDAFARYYDEIRPTLLRSGTWSGELPVLTESGEAVPMAVTIVGRVGPGGEINGLVTHGRELGRPHNPAAEVSRPAAHDELTMLPQRAVLDDRLHVALARAKRDGTRVAVLLVDVDSLKDVNDTFGHSAGDEVLRALARRMTRVVREADTVARVGGDEFVVLFDGIADIDAATTLAQRVREIVCRTTLATDGDVIGVTASFGLAIGEPHDRPEELVRRADAAMYRAKAIGGGRVVVHDDDAEISTTTLADDFAVAVSHGLIRPHVQPVVSLRTGMVAGYQGLARWEHPEHGMLDAAAFIDAVSNTPMAPVVDLAVLRRSAAVAARAARRGGGRIRTYGHLSRRLIGDERVDHYLVEIARDLGLSPDDICVEVPHALVARKSRAVATALRSLREAGIRTVLSAVHGECEADQIVDYGFDEIRLSRSLVGEATSDPARRRIMAATVALAHALDVPVIAVGVESGREAAAMLEAGCDYAQGLLFGPVVPAGTAE